MKIPHSPICPSHAVSIIDSIPCGICGPDYLLPPYEFLHVITDGSPQEIIANTLEGTLHEHSCPRCGHRGHLNFPTCIYLSEYSRIVYVIPDHIPPTEHHIVKDHLNRILKDLVALDELIENLPSQTTNFTHFVPALLEISVPALNFLATVRENRLSRLTYPLETKKSMLVKQMVELFSTDFGLDKKNSKLELNDRDIYTVFEAAHLDRHEILQEISDIMYKNTSTKRSREKVAALGNFLGTDIQRDLAAPSLDAEQESLFDALSRARLSLDRKPNDQDLYLLINSIDYFHKKGFDRIAIDLSEYYVTAMERGLLSTNVKSLIKYGALLVRLRSEVSADPTPFLSESLAYMEAEMDASDSEVQFYKALCHEYLALHYGDIDQWPLGRSHAIRAAEIFLDLNDRPKEFQRNLDMAIGYNQVAPDLADAQKIDALFDRTKRPADNEIEERSKQLIHENKKQLFSSDHKIRNLTFNVFPPGLHWDTLLGEEYRARYGSVICKRTPVNYAEGDDWSQYGTVVSDVDYYGPYEEQYVTMVQNPIELLPDHEFCTIRFWEKSEDGEDLVLEFEDVWHPVLNLLSDNSEAGAGVQDLPDEVHEAFHRLYSWAASHGRFAWLLRQFHPSFLDKEALQIPRIFFHASSYGMALALSARRISTRTVSMASNGPLGDSDQTAMLNTQLSQLVELSEKMLANALGYNGEVPMRLPPSLILEARSLFASLCELRGDSEKAKGLYKKNVNSVLFSGGRSGLERQLELSATLGGDLSRFIRTIFGSNATPFEELSTESVFQLIEAIRSQQLYAHYLKSRSKNALDTYDSHLIGCGTGDLLLIQPQLTLVQSFGDFSGFWLAMCDSPAGIVSKKIDWTPFYRLHLLLEKIYRNIKELSEIGRKKIDDLFELLGEILESITDIIVEVRTLFVEKSKFGYVDSNIPCHINVVGQSYLASFPWMLLTLLDNDALTTLKITCLSSSVSLECSRHSIDRRSKTLALGSVRLCCDPLGDLPETHSMARFLESDLEDFACFTGLRCTKSKMQQSIEEANLFVYIGHGKLRREIGQTALLACLGDELTPDCLPLYKECRLDGIRVAVVLACWGGTLDPYDSVSQLMANGMPSSLKRLGYDWIVTSMYPISPKMAVEFGQSYIDLLSKHMDPVLSFSESYRVLARRYGRATFIREAGGLMLIG